MTPFVTVFVVAAILLALAGAWILAAAFRRPIATARRIGRWQLGRAGLRRHTMPCPLGTLTWWSGGNGPTVVLLHGAGDTAGSWARVARALVRRHHVVAPDLAGHGESSPAHGPLSLSQILEGLRFVLDSEAVGERVTLVGNSMGGWVALLFALRSPQRVRLVVLENGTGLRGEGSPLELVPKTRTEAQDLANRVLGAAARPLPAFVLDDMMRELARGPVARLIESDWERFLLDGRLGEVAAPVDLIWGERDGVLSLPLAERTAAALRDARLHVVPGGGHILHRDRAADFIRTVQGVLEAHGVRP